ncbi:hypothetical protein LCM02_12735 [Lutimonas saemankumensis]|uniref:hypothetical protein n=1 Tax=Lutimonas saemankumensis TaxID=483016 RepID=UPI001CD763CB|nr:hypothetical protein [Lutimonas saemankumensis]MCA0933321.1 hypothetical protein [Lutimonas saemankumensis]
MKNYLLVLFAFLLLAGCDQGKKQQNLLLQKTQELDSVLNVMEIFSPDLTPRDVTIEVKLIKQLPKEYLLDTININDYIQLVEGNSGSIIGQPQNFTVTVFAGKKVKWKGKKLPGVSGQKPRIEAITMKDDVPDNVDLIANGTRIDGDNDMEFDVKQNMNLGDKERYKIIISFGQGNKKQTTTIDPVLNYHP